MTLDDAPSLLIVALCLKELRGVRLGIELALAQLRDDLRAVLGLLTAQRGGGGLELAPGGLPPGIGEGQGDEPEAVQEGAEGRQEVAGLQRKPGAPRVSEGGETVGHRLGYRPAG